MCPCGGEMTEWCFECGDYACDDCGCPNQSDHDEDEDLMGTWKAEIEAMSHDELLASFYTVDEP